MDAREAKFYSRVAITNAYVCFLTPFFKLLESNNSGAPWPEFGPLSLSTGPLDPDPEDNAAAGPAAGAGGGVRDLIANAYDLYTTATTPSSSGHR